MLALGERDGRRVGKENNAADIGFVKSVVILDAKVLIDVATISEATSQAGRGNAAADIRLAHVAAHKATTLEAELKAVRHPILR